MTRTTMIAAAAAVTLVLLVPQASSASKPLAQREGVSCTVCHDKPGSKLLTDKGKYYEHRRTFEGYAEIRDAFGKCTACHIKKPGSEKLTRTGREFAGLVADMKGLASFCEEFHSSEPGGTAEPAVKPPASGDPSGNPDR